MRISTFTSVLLGTVAPFVAYGAKEDFDNLFNLVDEIRAEAEALLVLYEAKEAEVSELLEQCAGPGTQSVPTPTPAPARKPSSPGNTKPTAQPSTEPIPSSSPVLTPEPSQQEDDGDNGQVKKWTPRVGEAWNYNLATPVDTDTDVDVFFIDMDNAQSTIDAIHAKGAVVVCYISIGTIEDWRSDASEFPKAAIGADVDGWAGEKWVDVKNNDVRQIMSARVETGAKMGCDGIEPDNMMTYTENNKGVDVSEADQIEYNSWFADLCHFHGLAVGLKNAIELAPVLVNKFDFAINEECFKWNECDMYTDTFLAEGKPVFNVEYEHNMDQCDQANKIGVDSISKNLNLQAPVCSCKDSSRDIDCTDVVV